MSLIGVVSTFPMEVGIHASQHMRAVPSDVNSSSVKGSRQNILPLHYSTVASFVFQDRVLECVQELFVTGMGRKMYGSVEVFFRGVGSIVAEALKHNPCNLVVHG